jgi:hypothetical protein
MNAHADAAAILDRLAKAGITVTANGDKLRLAPKRALTEDILALVRQHKPELLRVLAAPASPARQPEQVAPGPVADVEAQAEGRAAAELTQRLRTQMAARPDFDLLVLADDELLPDAVLVAVGRRGGFSCVLSVDPERYDGFQLLELVRQHGGTVH